MTHVSSNTYSQSSYDHDYGAVPDQAVAADFQDSNTAKRLPFDLGYNTRVPTIGDLEIIHNRIDDIKQLCNAIYSRGNNAGICKMTELERTWVTGVGWQRTYAPTWREWTVQSGTP